MDPYQAHFDTRQETPAYWHNKSHDLLISARILWKAMQENKNLEVNCWATYKMLMGMSFELVFKAHCVGADVEFNSTHDLVALAHTASISISKDEKHMLRVLSEYVIWDGRYPTPKKPVHLKDHWQCQAKLLDDKLNFENLMPLWRRFSDSFMAQYN